MLDDGSMEEKSDCNDNEDCGLHCKSGSMCDRVEKFKQIVFRAFSKRCFSTELQIIMCQVCYLKIKCNTDVSLK